MSGSTNVVFHGRKASNNGFSLFVNTDMLVATDSKVAGCFAKVASTAATALEFVNKRRATEGRNPILKREHITYLVGHYKKIICLFIYLFMYLFIYLFIYLFFYLFIYLLIYLKVI